MSQAKQYLVSKESSWYEPSNEYSSLFQKKFDLPAQRRRFVEEQVDSKLPSIGYSYMVSLFQAGYFDTIFTTNFDDLINEAFYQFSRERPTLCAHDSSIKGVSVNSSRPKIIKLHGDYLFDSIKSTLNETESLETNTREKLIEFTKKYGLIFIGYAGNDRSIIDVINYLLRQDEFLGNGIYWCFRKDDEINPDVHKILKKERVYYIEIEGFDQALAELHYHIIGKGLSLESNFKSTKREAMLTNFVEDIFKLSENAFISDDIRRLQSHTNKLDISNLINELSGENFTNSSNFTEADFRSLLTLDTLIKNKKFAEAEKEALRFLSTTNADDLKQTYLTRLISVYVQQDKFDLAIDQADKTLEIDEYSISNNLRKLSLYRSSLQKMDYVTTLVEKFKFSSEIRNQYAREALRHRSSKLYKNEISLEQICEKLKESLAMNPSLDNGAWSLLEKVHAKIKDVNNNTKEYKDAINKLIEKMSAMNPHHLQTLEMKMRLSLFETDIDKTLELLTELDEVYTKSSNKKRAEVFDLILRINIKLPSFKKRDKSLRCSQKLFETYEKEFDNPENAYTLIFKAEFLITYERDLLQAKELIIKAFNLDGIEDCCQPAVDILLYGNPDIDNADQLIEKCKPELSLSGYFSLKSQVAIASNNFDEASGYLEKASAAGFDYATYLTHQSYIYLHQDHNQKVINLISTGIEALPLGTDKEALIVNRELANKRLKNKLAKVDIQNIIGKDKKGPASIAAHILLDEEIPARRILDEIISNDYEYYYIFQQWPVIPRQYLEKYADIATVDNKLSA